jgi:hypothetical protein
MTAAAKRRRAAAPPAAQPKRSSHSAEAVAAEWLPLSKLKLWASNPRNNDGEPVERVFASIIEFGWGAAIVARRANGEVIAGHTRYKAAQTLIATYGTAKPKERAKWHADAVRVATRKEAPTRLLDISERKAHLLALTDNRSNELTPWSDMLGSVLSEFSLDETALAGWDQDDIDKFATAVLNNDDDNEGHGSGEGDSGTPAHRCPACGHEFSDA